jgi:hypothetical protein
LNASENTLSYTDLTGATLKEANLDQAISCPAKCPNVLARCRGEGQHREFQNVRGIAENVRGSPTSEMVFWSPPSEQRVRDRRSSI